MLSGQIGCTLQAIDYALALRLTRHTFRDPARENDHVRTIQLACGLDGRLNGSEKLSAIRRVHRTDRLRYAARYDVDAQAERFTIVVEVPVFRLGPLQIFRSQFYVVVAGGGNLFEPLRQRGVSAK